MLVTAPSRDGPPLTSKNLYWRLRAACYHLVPGVVRFYDTNSLPRLVEDQGLTVVECKGEPGRASETVRIPGLPDLSMFHTVSQAQRALFMTAVSSPLAGRYTPIPGPGKGAP